MSSSTEIRKPIIRRTDILHIYQLSADKGVIFYDTEDFLVFFTFLCVKARLHAVTLAAVCIMLNHFHLAVTNCDLETIRRFMHDVKLNF